MRRKPPEDDETTDAAAGGSVQRDRLIPINLGHRSLTKAMSHLVVTGQRRRPVGASAVTDIRRPSVHPADQLVAASHQQSGAARRQPATVAPPIGRGQLRRSSTSCMSGWMPSGLTLSSTCECSSFRLRMSVSFMSSFG